MGNEVFIGSLLQDEVRTFPELVTFGGRRLLGLLGQVIEYYFEMDTRQRFTEVVFPLGLDSWFMGAAYVGHHFWEIDPSARLNFAAWAEFRRKFQAAQPINRLTFRQQLPSGKLLHYMIEASPCHDDSGLFMGYAGVVRDITEFREKDDYVNTVEHVGIGIAHISKSGHLLFANHNLCGLLGYSREELVGMHVDQFSHAEDKGLVFQQRKQLQETGRRECIQVEKRYRRKAGDYLWVRLTITEMNTPEEEWGFDISVVEDITERVRAEENFKYRVTHDELTALPNRILFTHLLRHSLELACRYSRNVSVLLIDLDRFKKIIDSLGHGAGDLVLQEMGQRFKKAVRSSDVVARLGGDEFIILLQEVQNREQVAKIANNILECTLVPVKIIEQECRITASIGIAMYPEDGDDDMSLLRRADQALYLAKGEGKNNYQRKGDCQ